MNKTITKLLALVLIVTLSVSVCTLAGCDKKITHEEAFEKMKDGLEKSLTYDVFFWKEVIRDGDNVSFYNANVHADANNSGFILDENGDYTNYSIRLEGSVNSKSTLESYCGMSKSSKDGESAEYLIEKKFATNELGITSHSSSTKKKITAREYYQSEEFKKYTLAVKLSELSLLTFEDLEFDFKGAKSKTNGVTMSITTKVKDSYLNRYFATYGKESILKGEKVDIETAYDRISKIVVYEKEDLGNNFTNYIESYKFELVYLGKNIWIPSYDDEKMKYE